MIRVEDFQIYLYKGRVDFRRSISGLAMVVQEEMKLDVFQKALFLFVSRNRRCAKILYWDRTGFALWMKRLEKDKFPWPKAMEDGAVKMTAEELSWFLSGYEFWRMKPHETLQFTCAG
jgi:transposase